MRNIWRVYTRDVARLLRVPQAWIIVVGIVITPALYAWVNIIAFWDPYGSTSQISVAVANLDEGATSDLTGQINVGQQIVEQLQQNDQLGWTFVDATEAAARVKSGESYAALIIPEDFSADLLSITTADFTQPELEYLVNEKANAVAPKITDVGANKVVEEITSTFTSVVATAAVDALADAGAQLESQLSDAQQDALTALAGVSDTLTATTTSLTELQSDLTDAQGSVATASATLTDVDTALQQAQSALTQSQDLATAVQDDLATFTQQATDAYAAAAGVLSTVSAQSHSGLSSLSQAALTANARVESALDDVAAVVQLNGTVIGQLEELLADSSLDPQVAEQLNQALTVLSERNTQQQELLADLQQADTDASDTIASVEQAATAIDTAIQGASDNAQGLQQLVTQTVPQLSQQVATLAGNTTAFSSAIEVQRAQLAQAQELLSSVSTQLAATATAVGAMTTSLTDLTTGLAEIQTDVAALGSGALWADLQSLTSLDAEQIAEFMASPVQVSEQVVFPVDSYGSAMAALFTNLSLWIGAFVLMVILKLEVDAEGVPGLSARQGYLGRWLLLATISVLQGVLVTAGNLVLGVQTVNAPVFMLTGVIIAVSYLSIIYALSVSFTYVGKGLCIILVIMQIPGTSGLYPIEMMPSFFRRLYPFFPFTYGIDAMRETISGFYDGHYWQRLAVLSIFVAGSFLVGLVLRSHLGTLNAMVNRHIESTDLLVAEEVSQPRGYRLSQLLRFLADRGEFQRSLEHRAKVFAHHYPRLLRGGLIGGFLGPVVLFLIPSSDPSVKALLLGLWVAWFLLLFAYLITVEYLRDSIDDGLELSIMPDADLRRALTERRNPSHAAARRRVGILRREEDPQ